MLKDQILSCEDRPAPVPVSVPEWPCKTVHVRVMSGAERDSYDQSNYERSKRNEPISRAELLVRCICDESGNRTFEDKDAPALARKNAIVLDRIWDQARRMNGMTAEAAESLEKNSDAAPSGDSGSNLP